MAASFEASLSVLAKARFPIIYVETFEERRALAAIRETLEAGPALASSRPVHTWSCTAGLVGPEGKVAPGTTDPSRALDAAMETRESATFVFLDLHAHLGDGTRPADAGVVRKLREAAAEFQRGELRRTIIILAPIRRIPAELEKDIHLLDFPLPDEVEIRSILDQLIMDNAGNRRLEIDLAETDKDRLVRAAVGLTETEAEGALALAMAEDGRLDASDVETVLQEKKQAVRKSGLLDYIDTDIDLDGVGGLDNLKRWLSRRDGSWLAEARYYGVPAPRGVLITGVPGCGKSLTAKAVASAWCLPLLRLDVGKMFSGLVGSSESNLRSAIRSAEAASPAVLWVDEIEKGFSGVGGSGDSGTSSRVFGAFLTWMQEKTAPVFVIATSNNVRDLPPELLRKGRFDEIFFVDLPNEEEREQIWRLHVAKHVQAAERHSDFVLDKVLLANLVATSEGFSGAEIEQAVLDALFDAFASRRALTGDDLVSAVNRSVPLSVTQAEQLSAVRAWASERAVAASARPSSLSGSLPASPPGAFPGGSAGTWSATARSGPGGPGGLAGDIAAAGRRVEF
ncbi:MULTISPECIES: AAA family ATPase [Actinomyces]|uniref:AAA family ATPase n=1 Tax=Actinomyces TaxID=1654 RepID=UPI0019699DEE|nr:MULTISPECIES: AAA family ATPase [Actinomyces]